MPHSSKPPTLAGIWLNTQSQSTIKMIKLFFALGFLIVVTIAEGQSTSQKDSGNRTTDSLITTEYNFSGLKPIELPRPNSEIFSYEQAGKRKNEIYNLQQTPKYFDWKNPTSGGAVHINKKDEIEVYQFTLGIYQYTNDTGAFYTQAPKDTFIIVKNSKDLLHHVGGIGLGNHASVLITSEISLSGSNSIKKILDELWTPSVQIYFLTKK